MNKLYLLVHEPTFKNAGGHHHYASYLFKFLSDRKLSILFFDNTKFISLRLDDLLAYYLKLLASRNSIIIINGLWGWYSFFGFALSILFFKKCFIIPHGMASSLTQVYPNIFSSGLNYFAKKKLAGLMFRYSSTVIATSEKEKKLLTDSFKGINKSCVLSPASLYLPVNNVAKNWTRLLDKACPFTVLAAGRFTKAKGFDILLSSWSHFLNVFDGAACLTLLGPLDVYSRSALLNLPLKISQTITHKLTSYTFEDFMLYASLSHCAISTSPIESFGMVIYESLACSLPTIVSNGSPWQNIEDFHAGFSVKHNYSAYAEKLLAISSFPPQHLLYYSNNALRLAKYVNSSAEIQTDLFFA